VVASEGEDLKNTSTSEDLKKKKFRVDCVVEWSSGPDVWVKSRPLA
jgi:hypothetical protein